MQRHIATRFCMMHMPPSVPTQATHFGEVHEDHEFRLAFGAGAPDPAHLAEWVIPNHSFDQRPTEVLRDSISFLIILLV